MMTVSLTRFNQIAVQLTPQMAADKEAIRLYESLLILFYAQPALILSVTRLNDILVYSVLEHINTKIE